jgi:hypothetical protein
MYYDSEGNKERWRRGNEARKHITYNGAKHSTVKHWFPANVNCFVKCIFMQRIKYLSIMYIHL